MKQVHIYDLDGTLICSRHRCRIVVVNGKQEVDLNHWCSMATPENIAKDRLLPLAASYIDDLKDSNTYVVIATVRKMTTADFNYVKENLGLPAYFIYRRSNEQDGTKIKVNGLKRLLNLKQFKKAIVKFWEDNPKYLNAVTSAIPRIEGIYVPSEQGY